jgi:hypothetical protein
MVFLSANIYIYTLTTRSISYWHIILSWFKTLCQIPSEYFYYLLTKAASYGELTWNEIGDYLHVHSCIQMKYNNKEPPISFILKGGKKKEEEMHMKH